MNKMAVYKQMTASPADLFGVLRQEIGVKSNCIPFAWKAIEALSSLGRLNEAEAIKAANTFLSNMQTLTQGGIIPEDYDKTDFVKRGGVITISARVEAFYRAARRKGYQIIDTIIAVPVEDGATTYFKENLHAGEIVYTLEDRRIQGDRTVTAKRLISNYFFKFICRLEVRDTNRNARVLMTTCEMSNEEVLNASATSDNGIYKAKWEEYTKDNGYKGNRRVILDEINAGSVWNTWTSEMVNKTVIRRALKRVKEVLPELKDTIYAFESDDAPPEPLQQTENIDIPLEVVNVDLDNLTEQQKEDVTEMFNIFVANPKMAEDKANEIMGLFNGSNAREIINSHYACIVNIRRSKALSPIIAPLFERPEELSGDRDECFVCEVCGKQITSKNSIRYYSKNPSKPVRCYNCNKKR